MSPITVLGSAISWSLVAAAVHVGAVMFHFHVLKGFTRTTQLFALTSPLAYAVIFGIVALPLAIGAALHWTAISLRLVTTVFCALAVVSMLLVFRFHPASFLVIAAVVGWQVGQWFAKRPTAHRRLTRAIAPCLAALLLVVGALPVALSEWNARQAIRRDRTAPPGVPNVLLLILDTVRAANLSAYGYERLTSPALDSLARVGVRFENAFTTASWSLPAHTSIMTGVWAHQTGGHYLRRSYDSLPRVTQVLQQNGWVTAAFMGNAGWAGHESGMQIGMDRFVSYRNDISQLLWSTSLTQTRLGRGVINGLATANFRRLLTALLSFDLRPGGANVTAEIRRAPELADAFLRWQKTIGNRHPWFATINLLDAHDPEETPLSTRFNNGQKEIDRYDGAIAWVDSAVGGILHELAERGDLDRTLVIVTSDHGEKFGEHGEHAHGGGLYLPVVQVPLIVRYPARFPAGMLRTDLVTTADIPATILDVAGVEPALPGHSLAGESVAGDSGFVLFLSQRRINPPTKSDRYALGDTHGVLTNQWHFIQFPDSSEELYRWRTDTAETANLVRTPEGAAAIPRLRALLKSSRARPGS